MTATVTSTFPLSPVTFNPYYEQNVPHAVVVLDGVRYIPVSYKATFNAHGVTDDVTFVLTLSDNPDFTAALFRGPGKLLLTAVNVLLDPNSPNLTPAQQAQVNAATQNTPIFVQVWAGFRDTPAPTTDITGLTQRFYGILDTYSMDVDGDEVTFTARSLASPFVDQKLTFAPLNMSSLQFVQAMAKAIGLKTTDANGNSTVAVLPGAHPITLQETLGREFIGGPNFSATVFNMHPWDLFIQTALFDDCDVWVANDTIFYLPPSLVPRTNVNLQYGGDGQSPGLIRPVGTHSVQLNKNIRVEVRTYSRKTRQSTVYRVDSASSGIVVSFNTTTVSTSSPIFGTSGTTSTSISPTGGSSTTVSNSTGGGFAGTTSAASESGKLIYKLYRPNLTPQRCNQLAMALWRQYSMHEFSLSFELPVTAALLKTFSITSLLRIGGLPYDQFNSHNKADMYYPRQIVESFDTQSGWAWSVQAVNSVLPQGAV